MGGAVSSLLFTCGQTMVEVMKIMMTFLKRSQTCTAKQSVPPTVQQATRTHASARDSWTPTGKSGQSPVGSLLFSPGSWYTGFCCALQESIFQSCVSSGSSLVGLMATSSKRVYVIPKSAVPRAPVPGRPLTTLTPTGDAQTQFCLSLSGVPGPWCTQGWFEPYEHLWREWGLILNANSPFLSSCWTIFFALGHGVSHSHSSAYHLTGVPLALDVGYLHTAGPATLSCCS